MKKKISILLASVLLTGALSACSSKPAETAPETTEATTVAETTAETTAGAEETTAKATEAAGDYKTGLAIVSSLGKSKDASADKEGNAQVDSVAAAVVVDADGKIVSCTLDTAQNKMAFTAEGTVVMAEEFKTKKELKDEYGMKAASGIGKEWYEQAEAMEQYVIGKTAEEVAGIAVDEDTKPTDADLTASVTMKIGGYIAAISEAAKNASATGAQDGDKLGLGIITDMNYSKDASADKDGQCQAYSTYVALTVGADGKITSLVTDETQGTVTFDATGKITSDLTTGVKTKKQLGDEYGMKAISGIGKEWYEQTEALEKYVVGKTAEEVAGIAVNEDTKPTDTDLASSVTISIGTFQEAVKKAAANAK